MGFFVVWLFLLVCLGMGFWGLDLFGLEASVLNRDQAEEVTKRTSHGAIFILVK